MISPSVRPVSRETRRPDGSSARKDDGCKAPGTRKGTVVHLDWPPDARAAFETVKGSCMAEKRRALGRGLGALIPSTPSGGAGRPVDVFFAEQKQPEPAAVEMTHDTAPATAESPLMTDDQARESTTSGETPDEPSGDAKAVADDTSASSGLAAVPGAEFAELDIDSIRPNPKQPRTVFDEDHMAELVH